ncbi:hypothetical protein HY310_00035, partial [Candidatus Microgenomates bacterium]|nr:hypothetical protein [Candidatus Microgenomates bacterium]
MNNRTFPFIEIENKKYPSIIMGEDQFTSWFPKCKTNYKTETARAKAYAETVNAAYFEGVRGFSMSPHETLIKVLSVFKKDHPEIVCIANPHFGKNYYLNNESLWLPKNLERLTNTLNRNDNNAFSKEEIANFRIDTDEYFKNLQTFKTFCDFSLIGNLYKGTLLLLGRKDLIIKESVLVRKIGMTPLLICEAGNIALKKSNGIDCAGYWVLYNEGSDNLVKVNKPITAYKAFTRKDGFDVEKTINFFNKIKNVKSLVVGVENSIQAKETF